MGTLNYPYDPTGQDPNNRIQSESHTLTQSTTRVFAPNHGPFFTEDHTLIDNGTSQPLVPNQDYKLIALEQQATLTTGKEVCALVAVTNPAVSGSVSFTYQVVGGQFSVSTQAIDDLIQSLSLDNRPVDWGQIIGLPTEYPPTGHLHDINDVYGWQYVVLAMQDIVHAINEGDQNLWDRVYEYLDERLVGVNDAINNVNNLVAGVQDHTNKQNNPHGTTKGHVGLGNVHNFGIATKNIATLAQSNSHYMTPLRTYQLMDLLVEQLVQTAIYEADLNIGPNSVGLGAVKNYGIASATEARNGNVDDKYMTPNKVAEYVINKMGAADGLASLNAAGKIKTSQLPSLTPATVGLMNVKDYDIATESQARAGSSNTRYMTPLRVSQFVNEKVNAAYVGLGLVENYRPATKNEAEAGTANNRYLTPVSVKHYVDNQKGSAGGVASLDSGGRLYRSQLPSLSGSDVNLGAVENMPVATQADAQQGTRNDRYMTPLRVKEYVAQANVGGSGDLDNVQNYAVASVSEARAGTRNDRYMTPLRVAQHLDDNVNKTKVGLSNVENYPIASTAEAQAGNINDAYMTPRNVAQYIGNMKGEVSGLATLGADGKLSGNEMPDVEKSDVGLGNVRNYGIASSSEAMQGNSNSKYMTPSRVADYVNNRAGQSGGLATLNGSGKLPTAQLPNISKSDVGLGNVENYGIASAPQAKSGTSNAVYMTPTRVADYVDDQKGENNGLASLNANGKLKTSQIPDSITISNADENTVGGIKMRFSNGILYITNNGDDA